MAVKGNMPNLKLEFIGKIAIVLPMLNSQSDETSACVN